MQNRGLVLAGILFTVFILAILLTPTPTDWRYTYSKDSKIPHGSFIVYEELEEIFPNAEIIVADSSTGKTLKDWDKPNTAYISINNYFDYYDESGNSNMQSRIKTLDEFVGKGNQAFISANSIYLSHLDSTFLSKGSINTRNILYNYAPMLDVPNQEDSLTIELLKSKIEHNYLVDKSYVNTAIYLDSLEHYQLGTINDSVTNFVRIPVGTGNYFFHTAPNMFTNVIMLQDSLANYAMQSLAYIGDVDYVIWDEYYKPHITFLGRGYFERKSALYLLNENLPLKIAKWLVIIGALLLILTKFKRKQRAIPIINPPANKTVEFATNMGKLYHEKGEHFQLAQKKIEYFEFNVRKKYQVKPIDQYQNKQEELAKLTGFRAKDLEKYFQKKMMLSKVTSITEDQLISISNAIENLKKNQQ